MGILKDAASVIKLRKTKRYCWELIKCGREPGGHMAAERGICPAAIIQTDREPGEKTFCRKCFQ
ncbi:MAG TPA: hypothetical protein VL122_00885 [Nitrospirota bacterium]|nr:hypothetical protein [Nitrospirota bacterium]